MPDPIVLDNDVRPADLPTDGGHARAIRTLGDPVLRSVCAPVTAFDGDLRALVADMFASMYSAEGVGLAANQIGVDRAVFVYDCPFDDDDLEDDEEPPYALGVVVNPRLVSASGEEWDDTEGCLSVPGMSWDTPRPSLAVVEGQDLTGAPVRVEGTGMLARCLQHETDHLLGRVYLDRLPRRERGRAFRHWDTVAPAAG